MQPHIAKRHSHSNAYHLSSKWINWLALAVSLSLLSIRKHMPVQLETISSRRHSHPPHQVLHFAQNHEDFVCNFSSCNRMILMGLKLHQQRQMIILMTNCKSSNKFVSLLYEQNWMHSSSLYFGWINMNARCGTHIGIIIVFLSIHMPSTRTLNKQITYNERNSSRSQNWREYTQFQYIN